MRKSRAQMIYVTCRLCRTCSEYADLDSYGAFLQASWQYRLKTAAPHPVPKKGSQNAFCLLHTVPIMRAADAIAVHKL